MCIFCNATIKEIKEYGLIFGYPVCCIDEFIQDTVHMRKTGKDNRTATQKKIGLEKHGFVPCKKHAKMIKKGLITAEDLVEPNRNHEKSKELNIIALSEHFND
jgi:hypothetical protein